MNAKELLQLVYKAPSRSLLRAFAPLASNFLHLLMERPDRFYPFYVNWLITYRCNRKCLHCDWTWSKTNMEDLKREMSFDEKIELADQMAGSKVWGISVSGGEPLLDPAIMEILTRLKKGGRVVNLCTNATVLPKYIHEILSLKIDTVTISMDSHRKEVHDELRGIPRSFDDAFAGLRQLKELRKGKNPKIVIKSVISTHNYLELCEFVDFFKDHADLVEFQPVQDNYSHQVKDRELLFKPEQEPEFQKAITKLISRYPIYNTPYYRDMADYLFRPEKLINSGRFACLYNSSMVMTIDPYGNAGGCPNRFLSGNLRQSSFRDLWRSKSYFDDQKEMRKASSPCVCWNYGSYLNFYLLPFYKIFHKIS